MDKELFKQAKGKDTLSAYDAKTQIALESRKNWLVAHDLAFIQSGGKFALRDGALLKLDKLEVHVAGHKLAEKAGLTFKERKVKEGAAQIYMGYAELETGSWAVLTNGATLQMALLEKTPVIEKGSQVILKAGKDKKFEIVALNQSKEHAKEKIKDKDVER